MTAAGTLPHAFARSTTRNYPQMASDLRRQAPRTTRTTTRNYPQPPARSKTDYPQMRVVVRVDDDLSGPDRCSAEPLLRVVRVVAGSFPLPTHGKHPHSDARPRRRPTAPLTCPSHSVTHHPGRAPPKGRELRRYRPDYS